MSDTEIFTEKKQPIFLKTALSPKFPVYQATLPISIITPTIMWAIHWDVSLSVHVWVWVDVYLVLISWRILTDSPANTDETKFDQSHENLYKGDTRLREIFKDKDQHCIEIKRWILQQCKGFLNFCF